MVVGKLKVEDFRLKSRFEDLTDTMLEEALQIVNAQFSGVYEMWATLPPALRDAKRELCISYLVAWSLANTYPENVINLSGSGAMPISKKKAGPVFISYKDVVRQSGTVLDSLTTNEFGIQALLMIQTAPETYLLAR